MIDTLVHSTPERQQSLRGSQRLGLSCRCGAVRGHWIAANLSALRRYVCYCRDCQAFLRHLGRPALDCTDSHGGTDVVHAAPSSLRFEAGSNQLRCLDLRGGGTLRWYTACCKSPVGSTTKSPAFPFVSLITGFVDHSELWLAAAPPICGRLNLRHALGDTGALRADAMATHWMLLHAARLAAIERLHGRHRNTPFFRPDNRLPVSVPHRLTDDECRLAYGLTPHQAAGPAQV